MHHASSRYPPLQCNLRGGGGGGGGDQRRRRHRKEGMGRGGERRRQNNEDVLLRVKECEAHVKGRNVCR